MRKRELMDQRQFDAELADIYSYFEEGEEERAISKLHKLLKKNRNMIPAILFLRYRSMWDEYDEWYALGNDISLMSDYELDTLIERATYDNLVDNKVNNEQFRMEACQAFSSYMKNRIDLSKFAKKLYGLENKFIYSETYSKEFFEELLLIFYAYFFGRRTIKRDVFNKYERYIKNCFETKRFGDYSKFSKEMSEARLKSVYKIWDNFSERWIRVVD